MYRILTSIYHQNDQVLQVNIAYVEHLGLRFAANLNWTSTFGLTFKQMVPSRRGVEFNKSWD